MALKEIVHVVWAATGPIATYRNPEMAWAHARGMLGVDVTSCELRATLPDVVRDALAAAEFGDDDTPRIVDSGEDDGGKR